MLLLSKNKPSYQDQIINIDSYLSLIAFTENRKSCIHNSSFYNKPVIGTSKIGVILKFNDDTLSLCYANYKTNKFLTMENSGKAKSLFDLLELELTISMKGDSILPIEEIKDVMFDTNGQPFGEIKMSEPTSIKKDNYNSYSAKFIIRKEYFNGAIFKD